MHLKSKVLLKSTYSLGEGLHWDNQREVLWFVDINNMLLCSLNLNNKKLNEIKMPEKIGWAITCENSKQLILGMKSGIASITPEKGIKSFEWLNQSFPSNPDHRLNDAKADSKGRIWAGSMNEKDETFKEGSLARFDLDGSHEILDSGYSVTNGPALDNDHNFLFHTDSVQKIIYRFDVDQITGCLSNKQIWLKFKKRDGHPDGMCFDKEGCLWVAMWGSGKILRINKKGEIIASVLIPTKYVSNVCFAGKKLHRLIVTTANLDKTITNKATANFDGSIFEILNHGLSGMPVFSCRMSQQKKVSEEI
jgi:sugar lactone lactonase YvrE